MRFLLALVLTFSVLGQAFANWSDKISIGGDFRYRHEMRDDETKGDEADHRHRIRARLKVEGEINEDMKAIFRLASGGSSIVSTNQNLDTGSTNKDFSIDMAYIGYQINEDLELRVGKMANPTYRVNKSDILWDTDVTPEGLALMYECKDCDGLQAFANLGAMWIDEHRAPTNDVGYYMAQLGLNWKSGADSQLTFGVGNHSFSPLKGQKLTVSDDAYLNSINADVTTGSNSADADGYLHEYNLTEVFLSFSSKIGECPAMLYGNAIANSDSEQEAYVVGFKLGKAKEPFSYSFDYNFKRIEKDAVLSTFIDSDFNGGQTDVLGHTIKISMAIKENTVFGLTYSEAERGINAVTPTDYNFAQADFIFKF